MTETMIDQAAAGARDGLCRDGRVADPARPVPPSVTSEQADLIRFSHRQQGMSVEMIATIMRMTRAQVRLVLSAQPTPEPDHVSGCTARPSVPTDPVVPVGGAAAVAAPARQRLAKGPAAVTHATASGYVPIMSDAYRRRPA